MPGKSTQQRRIAALLAGRGIEVVTTREPGGTSGAEEIRALVTSGRTDRWSAMTELLLMMAARSDHLDRVIRPALERGTWVISDRFHDSSRVYQGIAGGLGLETVDRLHEPLLCGLAPALTIHLDVDVETGLARRHATGGAGRFEEKDLAFHRAVRAGFLELASLEPERFATIDATGDEEAVAASVAAVVERLFC